jgi:hypothetical protein
VCRQSAAATALFLFCRSRSDEAQTKKSEPPHVGTYKTKAAWRFSIAAKLIKALFNRRIFNRKLLLISLDMPVGKSSLFFLLYGH